MNHHQPADLRLREAHHRIANDLAVLATMVRLQAGAIDENQRVSVADVRTMLKDAAGRVEAVARLHRTLCADLNGRTATEFLTSVCADASKFASAAGWTVGCNVDLTKDLSHENLRALGLLMHELVLNSLKHAHPAGVSGKIDIWVREEGGLLAVDVRDDGVGFPDGFDPETADGFGFRMMRELAKGLDARLTFKSSPLGLTLRLRAKPQLVDTSAPESVAD